VTSTTARDELPPARARWSFADVLVVVALLGLLAVVQPLSYLMHQSFWLDEAWVASLARAPWSQLGALTSSTPIGWLLLVRWAPGLHAEALRVVPLAFAAATVVTAYVFCAQLGSSTRTERRVRAAVAGLVVVIAPLSLGRNDLKQYTADAFFALALLALASRVEAECNRRRLAQLTVIAAVAPFFSTVSAFVVAAVFGGLVMVSLRRGRDERLARLLGAAACAAVVIGAFFIAFVLPHTNRALRAYWASYYLPAAPLQLVQAMWQRLDALSVAFGMPALVLLALFVTGCAALVRLCRPAVAASVALLWLEMVALGLAHRYPFLDRRTSHFLLVMTLVVGAIGFVEAARVLVARRGTIGVAVAVLAATCYVLHCAPFIRIHAIPDEDGRGQVAYVAAHRRANDVVVVSQPTTYSFSYYWPGARTRYLPDPVSIGFVTRAVGVRNVVYASSARPEDTTDALRRAQQLARPGGRIWIVRTHLSPTGSRDWDRSLRSVGLRMSRVSDAPRALRVASTIRSS
jgi:hypothetical protein